MGDRAPPPNRRDEQALVLKMTACLPKVRMVHACLAITICWVLTTFLLVYGVHVYDSKNDEVYACNNRERTLERELSERHRNWSECERTLREEKSELHRNWTECEMIGQENAALFDQYSTAYGTIRDIQTDSEFKTRSIDRLTSQLKFCTVERGECETRFGELEEEYEQQGNKLERCEVENKEQRKKLEWSEVENKEQRKKTANLQTSIEEKDNELDRMKETVRHLSHTWEWQVVFAFVGGMVAIFVIGFIFGFSARKKV